MRNISNEIPGEMQVKGQNRKVILMGENSDDLKKDYLKMLNPDW